MNSDFELEFVKGLHKSEKGKMIIDTLNFIITNEEKYHFLRILGLYIFEDLLDGDMLLMKISSILARMKDDYINER